MRKPAGGACFAGVIGFAVNVVVLVWLMGAHRKLKHDVLVALLFGTIKAFLVGGLALATIGAQHLVTIVLSGLIRGLVSFLTCWGFLALLGRTERVEFEHRRATADGHHRKKPALVLEYAGMTVVGIVCLFS